ncbi:hypothetical protein BGZ80_007988 [Entomortierella chlamydospora]|uniref:P-loop containing nucleoside triphosphate hydrolase protein n=1 Tax=Entomortierella chlamydospora TaxID=101097 RepID=A0A9P6T455_9FUNG|nr:hypothetical protein BGZ80_007988 [Entomortierella chlamydospora]
MAQPSNTQPLLSSERAGYGSTVTKDQSDEPGSEASASLFSILTVSWLTPMFKIGYRRQLQESDIPEMLPERRASALAPQLQRYWDRERQSAAEAGRPPSLLRALAWFILPHYWTGQVSLLLSDNLAKLVPFIVLWIIVYLEKSQSDTESPPPVWYGYGLAVLLLITSILITLLAQYWVIISNRTGTLVRTAVVDLIFRKATTISSKARLEYPDGKIFNLMSTDATRIDDALEGVMLLVFVPLACIITVAMLMYLMGLSALLGTFLLMFANPLQAWAMAKLNPIREKASKFTDTRIHVVTEILQGIKVIKFFTFEPSFLKKVSEIRACELKCLSLLMQVRGMIYSFSSSLPVFASALSFVLYAALGNELKPQVVFPALTLFTGLRVPLLVLPYVYSETSDAWISVKRIEAFLLTSDIQPLPPVDTTHSYALSIKHADFYWDQLPATSSSSSLSSDTALDDSAQEQQPLLSDRGQAEPTSDVVPFLKDINLDIPRGSLVAVVGPVGSGKSSLLQAMVGNMMKSHGEVIRGATISYASQTHWIQNATIRNNILFDTPFDEERYWRVVKACSLEKDLSNMPYGDQTEIGERGVNLSGGQKARLSLARSVYYNADTVIMDDPLSAVDAHVGRSLWEDCVLKELGKKTRIIATHQLHVLPDVDYVVCMNHGRITEQGTFQSLMANEKGDFRTLMRHHGGGDHGSEEGQNADGSAHKQRMVLKRSMSSAGKVQLDDAVSESDDEITILSETYEETEEQVVQQSQMVEEERPYGAIPSQVYLSYIKLGGYWNWIMILTLVALQQAVGVIMSIWLSYWTDDKLKLPMWTYIEVYLGTGVAQLIIVIAGSIMLVMAVIKSSKSMHDNVFLRVLYAPMSFFDTTPMGRILNRLSKDITTIDSTLMGAINSFLITTTGIISVLFLSSFFLPWMTPIMLPLGIIYGFIAVYYQSTSREMKRIDSILRSHAYSYFSETLLGMGTLRAYHQHGIDIAIARNQHNVDRYNKARYHLVLGTRWISIRAFTVGYILNFVAVILIVWSRFSISPATAGLVLSYLARLSSEMNWAIQCFNQVENNMNSAERLLHYAEKLEQEPPAEIPAHRPDPLWPSKGQVSFRDVSMRYRDGLPLVLNNISFDVQAGHMVGVVGRTGAGKSSLIQALFRLVELESGSIVMDGIQTNTIGTADLRSKISIIPQDPVLFQGTVRYNLDPLSKYTEQDIWQALETSGMKAYVQQQEGGLDYMISTNGENLSVGQRQLVCLSRALLAKSKVVVLDEATASVDLATDSLIQKAIRVDFADSTVITIAHRLNTVVDYNRILVMDQGQVAEYDTPQKLLRDPNSMFSKMVGETGPKNAAMLRSLAGC